MAVAPLKYTCPCNLEPKKDRAYERWNNDSFPCIPGALTCVREWKTAIIMAEDCLAVSLASCVDQHKELPTPTRWTRGQELLTVQPLVTAQLDLYNAMRQQGVAVSGLAQRLDLPDTGPWRLLSLDYKTSINEVAVALELFGCNPAVEELAA